jgi:ssDNA-binding replication factor A large subunit
LTFQEDQEKEVMLANTPTRLKEIYINDTRVRVKVSLWREACDMPLRPGDYVTITDVMTSSHRGETSLSPTSKSTIQVRHAKTIKLLVHTLDFRRHGYLLQHYYPTIKK